MYSLFHRLILLIFHVKLKKNFVNGEDAYSSGSDLEDKGGKSTTNIRKIPFGKENMRLDIIAN